MNNETTVQKFRVGDRVVVKAWDEIPADHKYLPSESEKRSPLMWSGSRAKACGKHGEILDAMYSNRYKCILYTVKFDGAKYEAYNLYDAEVLVPEGLVIYCAEVSETDGRLYLTVSSISSIDEATKEKNIVLASSARLQGDDLIDYLQAVSFAAKSMYFNYKKDIGEAENE